MTLGQKKSRVPLYCKNKVKLFRSKKKSLSFCSRILSHASVMRTAWIATRNYKQKVKQKCAALVRLMRTSLFTPSTYYLHPVATDVITGRSGVPALFYNYNDSLKLTEYFRTDRKLSRPRAQYKCFVDLTVTPIL